MATVYATANLVAAGQTLITVPAHKKCVLTSMKINNQSGNEVRHTLRDIFTPNASHGTAVPVEQTINRLSVSVVTNAVLDLDELELKDRKFIGALNLLCDLTEATDYITIGYHFE